MLQTDLKIRTDTLANIHQAVPSKAGAIHSLLRAGSDAYLFLASTS